MKNVFFTLIVVVMAMASNGQNVWNGSSATGYAGGNGSKANPYLIETCEQLAFLSQQVNTVQNYSNDNYFKLVNNLDLGGSSFNWTPIGNSKVNQFRGVFDGNGMKISNLYIEVNNTNREVYAGLFGYLGSYSEVRDLGITKYSKLAVTTGATVYVGAIAGYSYGGKIINCYNEADILASSFSSISSAFAGGIVGSSTNDGVVDACYNVGNISSSTLTSTSYAGGIVGSTFSGKIINSHNTGNCMASGYTPFCGGIVGFNSNYCNIINCHNSGNVMSSSSQWDGNAGGIAGLNAPNGTVAHSYNNGNVLSVSTSSSSTGYYAFSGGIVGSNSNSDYSVTDCYNTGNVVSKSTDSSSSSCAGGIVGFNRATNYSIVNCYNVGNVASSAPVSTSPNYSSYSSYSYAGAITGYSLYNTVSNCYSLNNMATINGNLSDEYVNGALLMTAPNMKKVNLVEALNGNQNPAPWLSDVDGTNNGYPVLTE